jgi:hypothetical protein
MAVTEAIIQEYQEKQRSPNQHNHEETRTKQVAFSPIRPEACTKQVAFESQVDKEPIMAANRCKSQSDQPETHAAETPDPVAVEDEETKLEAVEYDIYIASSCIDPKQLATQYYL